MKFTFGKIPRMISSIFLNFSLVLIKLPTCFSSAEPDFLVSEYFSSLFSFFSLILVAFSLLVSSFLFCSYSLKHSWKKMIKCEKSIEYILYSVYELPERIYLMIQMFDVIENWSKDWWWWWWGWWCRIFYPHWSLLFKSTRVILFSDLEAVPVVEVTGVLVHGVGNW